MDICLFAVAIWDRALYRKYYVLFLLFKGQCYCMLYFCILDGSSAADEGQLRFTLWWAGLILI